MDNNLLKEKRLWLAATQKGLAHVMQVSERQYINWEKGHAKIPFWVPIVLEKIILNKLNQ